ncbi:hypothetical protein GCM10022243_26920 [Saccharothrix violaceirubra]|uniref:Flp pilus assembly protein TadB n=1 Tax=Saccharothrix violaceirubra TaxID=413306 RepID=A0A7W7TAC1_9PSEU|nr:hypothetical protein [Saccharothrix violaceirubra]MBB4969386.1 Flp pilus assembly protein TadB [Saccharothrix violaceirubra]
MVERALAEVRRQREAMAARIGLPVWFRLVLWVAWGGLLAAPVVATERERLGVAAFPYVPVAVVVSMVVLVMYRRRSGMWTAVRGRDYPGLRALVPSTALVFGGSACVVWGLALAGLPYLALSCVPLLAGLSVVQAWRVNAAVRLDVLEGR